MENGRHIPFYCDKSLVHVVNTKQGLWIWYALDTSYPAIQFSPEDKAHRR